MIDTSIAYSCGLCPLTLGFRSYDWGLRHRCDAFSDRTRYDKEKDCQLHTDFSLQSLPSLLIILTAGFILLSAIWPDRMLHKIIVNQCEFFRPDIIFD